MSYIVKNCPAITEYKFPYKVYKDCCQCTYGYCKDIDCVIKRVIENCKEVENVENVKTLYDAAQSGMFLQANKILKLLDIEEVRE